MKKKLLKALLKGAYKAGKTAARVEMKRRNKKGKR
jgi:hypothetical protein